MQSFQAVCAKNNQKVELIVQYNSLEEARQALHNQGYSIVDIKQIAENGDQGKVYYFDILLNNQKKSWQIQSNDIFKAYIKLVNDLHYQVISIYDDKNATEEEKRTTTSKIHSGYLLFLQQNTKKEVKKEEKIEQTTQVQAAYSDISETFIGKEIQKYYGLIDKILQKIENILNTYGQNIDIDRRMKLQDFLVALKQLKNTTNIDKLRIVSENALLKIGELELEFIQSNKAEKKQNFLNETNVLLKQFGSGTKIRNPETDILMKLQRMVKNAYEIYIQKKEHSVVEKKIDTQSFIFFKNLRELNLYKEKLRSVQKDLFMATLLFKKDKIARLVIRKKLIVQNIQLIEKRIKNVTFSYTSIAKWIRYYTDVLLYLFKLAWEAALYIVFLYSLFFIYSLGTFQPINYSILFFIVILSFFSFLVRIMKNDSHILVYVGIFMIFYVFLQLNF